MADKVDENEVICVDAQYNEVDCADPAAAWHMSRKDAKEKAAAAAPAAPVVEPEAPAVVEDEADDAEEKAVEVPPANKAVGMAPQKKAR